MRKRLFSSKYDIITEAVCLLMLAGMAIFLCVMWGGLPDKIPTHFNAIGEIDSWGGKSSLLIMPIITAVMYIILTAVSMFPKIWNTGVEVTEANKARVYPVLRNMINTIKIILIAGFNYLTYSQIVGKPLSGWFTPVFLILIFGSMIFSFVRLSRVAKA